MSRINSLEPAIVEEIPRQLKAGKLYISMDYGTVMHLCCCGCGNEVVTPLHPARWSITYDGESFLTAIASRTSEAPTFEKPPRAGELRIVELAARPQHPPGLGDRLAGLQPAERRAGRAAPRGQVY